MALDKVIDSAQLDADLTSIADAIREKAGLSDSFVFPDGFVEAVSGISAGDTDVEDGIITRKITEYSNGRVTSIGKYAFDSCISLTSVNFSSATSIGLYAFRGCTSLTSVDFPSATNSGGYAFKSCTSLTSVNFPSATSIDNESFDGCTSLTSVNFPSAMGANQYAFRGCTSLTSVDFPSATTFTGYVFYGCTTLSILILRKSEKTCVLSNTSAFYNTPFATNGTGGICLVPRALIESYQTATNWSALYEAGTCTFLATEDYTVDGTLEGELDWDKIDALIGGTEV